MLCPKCNTPMQNTHEPYELRCSYCGYWWDGWTQKEVDPLAVNQLFDNDDPDGEDWVSQCQEYPEQGGE